MSRHRAASLVLTKPQSPSVGVPGERLAALLGHTELERLYGFVLAFPPVANRLLTERRVPDPVVRYTLLAETALRLDKARHAVELAQHAVQLAAQETPVEAGRLLPAATVLADAAVVAGAPDTLTSCIDLHALAGHYGDRRRAAVAAGLHAIAIYQQRSCSQARAALDTLRHAGADGNVSAAATAAIEAIGSCCTRRDQPHWPPPTRPLITSGGLVCPVLYRPFLADRLLRWPGCHDCTTAIRRPA